MNSKMIAQDPTSVSSISTNKRSLDSCNLTNSDGNNNGSTIRNSQSKRHYRSNGKINDNDASKVSNRVSTDICIIQFDYLDFELIRHRLFIIGITMVAV